MNDLSPMRRLHKTIFPEQHGSRFSRAVWRLGDRMAAFACRRSGIDPMESEDLCTGFYGLVETIGVDLQAWHERRV